MLHFCGQNANIVNVRNAIIESVHRRRPKSGGGCPVWTFYGQGLEGVLQLRTFEHFLVQKLQIFLRNVWCVLTDKGVEEGEGCQFFVILCGRLLWMVPTCL